MKRFCPKDHDTWEVGRDPFTHQCRECIRQRRRRYYWQVERQHKRQKTSGMPELRALRQRWGISGRALSVKAGFARSYVNKIEVGASQPSQDARIALYAALMELREEARQAEQGRRERLEKAGVV